jgi:hypothetical protein
MDRVEEIEAAIHSLPPEEYRRLAQWFRELEQTRWDEQMDKDSANGKLDSLFEEAEPKPAMAFFANGPRGSEIRSHTPILESLSVAARRHSKAGT